MASPNVPDPYLDPATGILRNEVGAHTRADLIAAEGALTFARAVELVDTPVPPTGDLHEFQAIHRHLFQDVYSWAGELRTIEMRKLTEGAEFFLPTHMIDRAATFAAGALRDEGMLRGLGRTQFVDRLSHHYDQWNYIHPFREGNGRTQRLFWNRIAADAGWQLDWRRVHGAQNNEASRLAAEHRDFGPLRAMFDQIVTRPDAPGHSDPALLGIEPTSRGSADAARIAGTDTPLPPRAVPPMLPAARGASARPYRPPHHDRAPGHGR